MGFDSTDGALWMFSPFHATKKLIEEEKARREAEEAARRPTGMVRDITQTEAYKAQQARVADMMTRGQSADQARDKALAALMALRSAAPVQGAAPIAVTVPSFSLGRRRF